ncbi:hypothetical protein BG004_006621 [Podila humilis]|nr:hypothetical protein BG004_006621 [Podila humilis]
MSTTSTSSHIVSSIEPSTDLHSSQPYIALPARRPSLLNKESKKPRNAKHLSLFVSSTTSSISPSSSPSPTSSAPAVVTVSAAASIQSAFTIPCPASHTDSTARTMASFESNSGMPSRTLTSSPSLSSLSVTTPMPLKSFNSSPSLSTLLASPPNSFASRRKFTPAPLSSASLVSSSKNHSQLQLNQALPTSTRLQPSKDLVAQPLAQKSSFLLPPPSAPLSNNSIRNRSQPAHRSISAYFSDYSLECGVASPYTTEPVRVLPYLYLGAEHNASDFSALARLGITCVLNVALEITRDGEQETHRHSGHVSSNNNHFGLAEPKKSNLSSSVFKRGVEYKNLSWSHSQRNVLNDFPMAFEYIDRAVAQGGKVLVHCQLGVSRSASLVIAYVMRAQTMGLSEAYDYVKQLSAVISPNMTLMYQLAEFEKSLKGSQGDKDVFMSCDEDDEDDDRESRIGLETASDDEPPYPFIDMTMDPATVPSALPPSTPMKQEFFSQRVPESNQSEERSANMSAAMSPPCSRPRHARTPSGSSKCSNIVHSQPHNTVSLSPCLPILPLVRSRPTPYRRSPLTTVTNVVSPKTPTTDKFSRLTLNSVGSVPPAASQQDQFKYSGNSNSSAASISDVEMMMTMVDPPSPAITAPSTPNLRLSSTAVSSSASSFVVIPSSRPPSTSSVCSFVPSMIAPMLPPFGSSSSSSSESEDTEEEEAEEDQDDGKGICSPRNSWTFNSVVGPKSRWSGVSQEHTIAGSSTGNDLGDAVVAMLASVVATSGSTDLASATVDAGGAREGCQTGHGQSKGKKSNKQSEPKRTTPEYIFSPRPYTPFRRHETRSFEEFYEALCMGRMSE